MLISEALIERVRGIVGPEGVLTSPEDLVCYAYDATQKEYPPELVVRPREAQQVEALVRLAHEERVPLTPRGAASGQTGGSLPIEGGIALDLTAMNRILEIDPENLLAVVEPGVINADLQKEVEKLGLFYPPDPASMAYSTLGGNVAANAGGPRAIKYGVTRDYVLGLEVVTPRSGLIRTGRRTTKGVVGYNLTQLLVGSEGTIGVITRITLKLLPKPERVGTLQATFGILEDAGQVVSDIIAARVLPCTLELMDNACIRCAADHTGLPLPREAEGLLLIEVDGEAGEVERQLGKIVEICQRRGAWEARAARSEEEREELWQGRRALSPSVARLSHTKINEDIVVPRTKVPEMLRWLKALSDKTGIPIISFGHAGDGNLHVNVMTDERDAGHYARALEAVRDIFSKTVELGGTISGEHGVGISKADYVGLELEPAVLEMMKDIKRVFDPHNILNPGKIFFGSPKG